MRGSFRFDVIYGTVNQGNSSATAGVQMNNSNFTEYPLQWLRWGG